MSRCVLVVVLALHVIASPLAQESDPKLTGIGFLAVLTRLSLTFYPCCVVIEPSVSSSITIGTSSNSPSSAR